MISFGSKSYFPGEGMDTRQVSMLQSSNDVLPMPSGIFGVLPRLFENGSLSTFKRPVSEAEMKGISSAYCTRPVESTFTTNGEYKRTRQDITSLLYLQEDEDYVRPTQYALDLTLYLLENANAGLATRGILFPRGTSSTSDKGGIYVFWEVNSQSIQLEVPPRNGGLFYIHIISLDGSFMDKNVSPKKLTDALANVKLFRSQGLGTKNVPASAAAR